jgi:hypothetical protein
MDHIDDDEEEEKTGGVASKGTNANKIFKNKGKGGYDDDDEDDMYFDEDDDHGDPEFELKVTLDMTVSPVKKEDEFNLFSTIIKGLYQKSPQDLINVVNGLS